MKKGKLIAAAALVLALGVVTGATIAYLTDQTDEVKNTFTVGNINIDLTETTTDYKMVPGTEIEKDPKVTVLPNSEASWLFVKIEKSANLDEFIAYDVDADWTEGTGTGEGGNGVPVGVYYREVDAIDAAKGISYPVIGLKKTAAGGGTEFIPNIVQVKASVTKAMMDEIEADTSKYPTLTFTAYAVQKATVTSAADAWAIINE